MISLSGISFEFGGRYLYQDASWQINPGEKIGLIGANGTGKSTLLRILDGQYSIESGTISRLKDLTIGFLNQDLLSYDSDDTILHVAMQAKGDLLRMEQEIETILARLEHDHSEGLLHRLHDLQVEYEHAGGYDLKHQAEQVLEGLGFTTGDLLRPLSEFSGGWRMRVMLARIILQQPGILLLDEPTNHLDLPSIQWVEQYLKDYKGTLIVVSHDRYFLDKVVDHIAEIAQQKITVYKGNYSFYETEKALRDELQQNQYENQQQYIKEQQKLIDRFRYKASKASMAQSRIRMLERMDKVEAVGGKSSGVKIRFRHDLQPGKVIAHLKVSDKSYDRLCIFRDTACEIQRGDKIALVGANGKGKSTLLRMLAGAETFDGEREEGYQVVPAYFAQHQLESLHLANDLVTELREAAPDADDGTIRSVLGAFLFSGDDVFKPIRVLSGGEKSRVALAKTILSKANFLILDEPTNHLDIQSVSILTEVLQDYSGTYIVVSHDRYFLSRIANKIWWIDDHRILEYPGTYEEYEYSRNTKAPAKSAAPKAKAPRPKKAETPAAGPDPKKQRKKLQSRFDQLEAQLARTTALKQSLEGELSKPEVYQDGALFQKTLAQYKEAEQQLARVTQEWESVFEQLSQEDDAA
jgi:ATP-binding cassette subfamily F protein 3